MRKIPATMATQHPDHAREPFWHNQPLINTQQETYECFLTFSELGASEYKWDWEGKLVDESVTERLMSEHYDYFKDNKLGEDKFLTFRLPNPKVETEYRLGRAFMGIISAAGLSKFMGYPLPMFEVILPMTTSAEDMIAVQEAFHEVASIKHPLLKHEFSTIAHIELIPLFEEPMIIAGSDKILDSYLKQHKKVFGFTPEYMRPYVARSDPALNSGIIPTVLAIKIALSRYKQFEKNHNIKLFPIIGAGSLPFRGGINPDSVEDFMEEYSGVRTTTIQSAFRYDYPKSDVKSAIKKLELGLQKGKARNITLGEEKILFGLMHSFEGFYKPVIEQLAPIINRIAKYVPKRRERVQHIGLFGYSRGEGEVKLPRAITFTAALYSIGIPPELIATGRGIAQAKNQKQLKLLEKYYINLRKDLLKAGRFLNKENLSILANTSSAWEEIQKDVQEIENYLGEELKPVTKTEKEHQSLTSKILENLPTGQGLQLLIEHAAILRKSMG